MKTTLNFGTWSLRILHNMSGKMKGQFERDYAETIVLLWYRMDLTKWINRGGGWKPFKIACVAESDQKKFLVKVSSRKHSTILNNLTGALHRCPLKSVHFIVVILWELDQSTLARVRYF